jgi:hypothetical protein
VGSSRCCFVSYGPEKPFFDKTWELPDIETVKQQIVEKLMPRS